MNKFLRVALTMTVIYAAAIPVLALESSHSDLNVAKERQTDLRDKTQLLKQSLEARAVDIKSRIKEGVKILDGESLEARLGRASTTVQAVKRESLREKLQEKREGIKGKIDVKREGLKKKLGEERLRRIEEFAKKMFDKFEAAGDRLADFADKIEERLDKMSEKGADVTAARAKLEAAKTSIADAEDKLNQSKEKLTSALSSSDPVKSMKNVKAIVDEVGGALKKAHAELVSVISSFKPGFTSDQSTPAATTTPE